MVCVVISDEEPYSCVCLWPVLRVTERKEHVFNSGTHFR